MNYILAMETHLSQWTTYWQWRCIRANELHIGNGDASEPMNYILAMETHLNQWTTYWQWRRIWSNENSNRRDSQLALLAVQCEVLATEFQQSWWCVNRARATSGCEDHGMVCRPLIHRHEQLWISTHTFTNRTVLHSIGIHSEYLHTHSPTELISAQHHR